jgi:nitroimidazol reductase NimA-like FMN-containing flavoprotein (pyridoxamine 5'-phosphate oxidase superfamily)
MLVEEMTVEECQMTMSTAAFGRLASARDGQPYVVPIFFSMDGDFAYVFSMLGQKVEWMRLNPRVCLEVGGPRSDGSYRSSEDANDLLIATSAQTSAQTSKMPTSSTR